MIFFFFDFLWKSQLEVISRQGSSIIKKGDHIRLKIVGAKFLEGRYKSVGTIEEDYLGAVSVDN